MAPLPSPEDGRSCSLCLFAVRRIFVGMMRLPRTDLEGLLSFLVDVSDLESNEPFPVEFVARLQDLVPCDAVTYQEIDLCAKRVDSTVGIGPDGEADDEALYWKVGPCPISDYRVRTGDLSAVRMSDVIDRRRYQELPIFREYFQPAGLDHMVDVGLPAPAGRHRSFILFRRTAAGDFSGRDRAVLEMLRPHFSGIEARAALRRRLSKALSTQERDGKSSACAQELTPREREIVVLVAEGKTNAQIAAQLWIAPSTVKKHLEHVYEKVGVGRRTVAATLVHAIPWLD